jgi:protein-disulfide isomerase
LSRKTKKNRPDPPADDAVAARSKAGRGWIAAAVLAVALVAVGLFMYASRQSPATQGSGVAASAALASEHSPSLGEPTAKVHIVEFLDPACETCAVFFPLVKEIMAENPGRIRVSVRHVAFHDGAEVAVRVLEASRAQDKYWETLQGLFATQSRWTVHHRVIQDEVLRIAAELGLDMTRLQADMNSPAVTERIARDRTDAMTLQVTATPEFFVNGKPMPSFGEAQLRGLVAGALAEAY